MKYIKYIWILIILYLVCSARTCTGDDEAAAKREEQNIMSLTDSVKHVFMSDSLTDQLLRAYEITAKEKLNSFADYMKIISDTTLDFRFRQHAGELVRDLFVPGEIELKNWSILYPEPNLNTLELLLAYSLTEGISYWIQPGKINVTNPFTRQNDSIFTGALSFYQNLFLFSNVDTSDMGSRELLIDVYIIRKVKAFGNEQLRVWEVYLGDID